jgi:hypothetical protein
MVELQPRYEYRVWADALEDVRNNLQRLATASTTESSKETYVISATTDKCNAKIRGARMNIKILLATEQGLELWKPVMDTEFPLDKSVIAEQIFPCLELHALDLRRPRYSMDEFVTEVIGAQPQVAMVTIFKRRARFRLDKCLAEFTFVSIGKTALQTVAVESIEPDPVLRLVRQLQIVGMPNTNYIAQLKQVVRR